jgi:hypothetical protein
MDQERIAQIEDLIDRMEALHKISVDMLANSGLRFAVSTGSHAEAIDALKELLSSEKMRTGAAGAGNL